MANLRHRKIQEWSYRTFIRSDRYSIEDIAESVGYAADHIRGLCSSSKGYWPAELMKDLIAYLFRFDDPEARQDAQELIDMLIPTERNQRETERKISQSPTFLCCYRSVVVTVRLCPKRAEAAAFNMFPHLAALDK